MASIDDSDGEMRYPDSGDEAMLVWRPMVLQLIFHKKVLAMNS